MKPFSGEDLKERLEHLQAEKELTRAGDELARRRRELPWAESRRPTSPTGEVYHIYSAYSRGLDALWGMYPWLDRAPLRRNEAGGPWWKRREDYPPAL